MNKYFLILIISLLGGLPNQTIFPEKSSDEVKNRVDNSLEMEYKYIEVLPESDKYMYAFSKYAKPGKVTLFITSAHWCRPCVDLTNQIERAYEAGKINKNEVEVYLHKVTRSSRDTKKVLNAKPGYKMLKEIDFLTKTFPTTYITSPTTNCYNVIEGMKFDEILKDIQDLLRAKKMYYTPEYLIADNPNTISSNSDCAQLQFENKNLKKELAALKKKLGINNYSTSAKKPNINEVVSISKIDLSMNDNYINKVRLALKLKKNYNSSELDIVTERTSVSREENRLIISGNDIELPSRNKIHINDNLGFQPNFSCTDNSIFFDFSGLKIVSYDNKLKNAHQGLYIDIILSKI